MCAGPATETAQNPKVFAAQLAPISGKRKHGAKKSFPKKRETVERFLSNTMEVILLCKTPRVQRTRVEERRDFFMLSPPLL